MGGVKFFWKSSSQSIKNSDVVFWNVNVILREVTFMSREVFHKGVLCLARCFPEMIFMHHRDGFCAVKFRFARCLAM